MKATCEKLGTVVGAKIFVRNAAMQRKETRSMGISGSVRKEKMPDSGDRRVRSGHGRHTSGQNKHESQHVSWL